MNHPSLLPAAGAIVSPETKSAVPSRSEIEAMARRRFQDPKPELRGNWWTLRIYRDEFIDGKRVRLRIREKIAPRDTNYRKVQQIAAEKLRPVNQGLVTIGAATGFQAYVDEVYRETDMPLMAASTRSRTEGVLKNYLLPAFGSLMLCDLTPLTIQKYLSGMAKSPLAHESRDKIRDVLSSVLVSAKKYGLLTINPAEGLRLPPSRKGNAAKPNISVEQFNALLDLIREPYATMVYVAMFTGLRVSELIGLRWKNVRADSITIEERCCRGDWGAPKSTASNATISVMPEVLERIHRLKSLTVDVKAGRATRKYALSKSCGPNDLVFQSVRSGAVMRDNNILNRHIKPAGEMIGIPWVNWRCLRTSHATWLKRAGVHVRDAQALMRHSKASTTLDIYMQVGDESQREALVKLGYIAGSKAVN